MTVTLNVVITQYTINEEDIKCACAAIDKGTGDGYCCTNESYTYPDATSDATIRSEIESDLTDKGFTWDATAY